MTIGPTSTRYSRLEEWYVSNTIWPLIVFDVNLLAKTMLHTAFSGTLYQKSNSSFLTGPNTGTLGRVVKLVADSFSQGHTVATVWGALSSQAVRQRSFTRSCELVYHSSGSTNIPKVYYFFEEVLYAASLLKSLLFKDQYGGPPFYGHGSVDHCFQSVRDGLLALYACHFLLLKSPLTFLAIRQPDIQFQITLHGWSNAFILNFRVSIWA